MKSIFRSKRIASALAAVFLFSGLHLFGVATPMASAETQGPKSFEIGPGTGQGSSHFRTFQVPCGLPVAVTVNYKRLGDPGVQNDVQIVIELRQPGATESEDGPLVDSKTVTAERTEKRANLSGSASNRGCSIPWRVRVKFPQGATPTVAVTGNITATFNTSSANVNIQGGLISLNKGNDVSKNIGGSSGFGQGTLEVTGTWVHSVAGIPNPLNKRIKLKFELFDPQNTRVVASGAVYPTDFNETPKLRLTHKITSCSSGQWTVKITNDTNDDVANIDLKATFRPGC